MRNQHHTVVSWLNLIGLALLLLAVAPLRAEEAVARAVLVRGAVTRIDAAGAQSALKKDDPVQAGDTIETGPRGLAQLVFPDQSILYVKAESRLLIEAFHFKAEAPEEDRAITRILKGSMRAVTGVLGTRNPEQVEIHGGTTTIGIRGTAVEVAEGDGAGWRVTFDYGRGWAATAGGRLDVGTGESARAAGAAPPGLIAFHRPAGDPAELARTLVGLSPAGAEQWIAERAGGLEPEDLLFTVGLLREVPGFTPGHLYGTLAGASGALPLERRSELAGFAVRTYPQEARGILKSGVVGSDGLVPVLSAVLRGLEGGAPNAMEGVFQEAMELGITKEQTEQLLRELKTKPMQCD